MSKILQEHVRVAIVGAGPAGIGAAIGLAKRHDGPILLLDRWDKAGGIPAKYPTEPGGVRTYVAYTRGRLLFGQQFTSRLLRQLAQTKVELRLESTVIELDAQRRQLTVVDPQRGKHLVSADVVVLATGAREETSVERGWIAGSRTGQLRFQDGRQVAYDGLIVSGQLVPNAELLVAAGIATEPPAHIPLTSRRGQLSSRGCFAVGSLLGGFHGGQWCYHNGRRAAKAVACFLRQNGTR